MTRLLALVLILAPGCRMTAPVCVELVATCTGDDMAGCLPDGDVDPECRAQRSRGGGVCTPDGEVACPVGYHAVCLTPDDSCS